MAELIVEIGIEEIPARFFRKVENDLAKAVAALFDESGLAYEGLETHAAPRQLTLLCRDVATRQEDREEEVVGPPVRIAYDDAGEPSKALQGFLRKNPALSVDQLYRISQKKGEVVAGKVSIVGRETRDLLAKAIPQMLEKMHFPKNMRWGAGETKFVRPVRNLLALLDGVVIPFEFAGLTAGDHSFGHRIYGGQTFAVTGIDQYLSEKRKRGIVVKSADRKADIEGRIQARLDEVGGALVPDPELLDEVADLVETPYVVLGAFDAKFLEIPREILIVSLRDHQKAFTIQDGDGKLMPYFLSIANVRDDDAGLIRKGNEWVLNARLWDAKFFWEADFKKDFETLRNKLHNLVFQADIGSYHQKTERIAALAQAMAASLGWEAARTEQLTYAAQHCKDDLVSELVFEFPELQGQTGGLLMAKQGVPAETAEAVYDHYLPNSMDDDIPRSDIGGLVAVADKLDTLVGCFAIGLIPTGSKDPYALRRAAQGVMRVLIERELPLSLDQVVGHAVQAYAALNPAADLAETIRAFFVDRLRHYLRKEKGFAHDLTEAVLARDVDRVDQTLKRAEAIQRQQTKESFRTLALNLKRMNNVIADERDQLPAFDAALLQEPPEQDLHQQFQALKGDIEKAAADRDYNRAMDLMTQLAPPVETYFGTDGVYVNTEDEALRRNRKAMLALIGETLGLVADISCLD